MNKIALKFCIDSQNSKHTRFTIFDDHANAGTLCMDSSNFQTLCRVLQKQDCINFEVNNEIK